MKKERIKSIILIMLIITNLVLAEKIFVNEKLWLSGYNFFVSARNDHQKNSVTIAESLTMPEKIIVNTGYQSNRFIYRRNSENFSSINSAASKIIKAALSDSKSAFLISADDWYAALTAKSVYLSYPATFSLDSFASFYGIMTPELPISEFSDIVISENGNVYLGGGNYCKIPVTSQTISSIITDAAEEHSGDESVFNYSFDLFFDQNSGSESTILSPMILIYSEPVKAPTITSKALVLDGETVDEKPILGILPIFGVNKNSVRSYTEADGTLVYVENDGILKITPDGILTFTATGNGIYLSRGSSPSKTLSFIESVNSNIDTSADVCLKSLSISDTVERFEFDYMLEGYPVKFDGAPAISATVQNGYLTEYSQIIRHFEISQESSASPDFIEALDNVIESYRGSLSEMRITGMYPVYFDDFSGGETGINWNIDVDNILAE